MILQDHEMPVNVTATTSMAQAIAGAQYAVHAVPVQHSRAFLTSIRVGLRCLMQLPLPRLRHEAATRCSLGQAV